jgi:hypothetical protein
MSSEKSYQPGDPRLIMQWARRYAKSRTISFLVQWIFIVVMVLFIGLASAFTSSAYRSGDTGLLTVSVVMMVISIGVMAWFSISPWGSEIIWRVTNWLYGREGYASYSGDTTRETPLWLTALGGGLIIYHLVLAMLVSFQVLSIYHMQPASALYMAPFLMVLIRYQDLGFWAWIWPACYAVHGLLLFFDVRIFGRPLMITGKWYLLNMILPVFGYGLLAIIVGHLYSRYALHRLKNLTRRGLPPDTGSEAGV